MERLRNKILADLFVKVLRPGDSEVTFLVESSYYLLLLLCSRTVSYLRKFQSVMVK